MFDTSKYIINSKLKSYKYKVEESKKVIDEMFDMSKKPYIAWSGGKDSTALVYLITQDMGFKNTLIFCQKDDCDFPDEMDYVSGLIDKYKLNCDIIQPSESMWNYIVEHKVDLLNEIHKKSNDVTKKFFTECINKFLKKHTPDCAVMGLRKYESKARLFNFYKHKHLYHCKYDNLLHCNPISNWTYTDVFSYMIEKDIPILPLYKKVDLLKGEDSIRKSWWIPSSTNVQLFGGVVFLKTHYPELYNKLREFFPEIACSV